MLEAVGVDRLEDLFTELPGDGLFPDLDLPPPVTELEVASELAHLGAGNLDAAGRPCFLGAGAYRHFVPATVDYVLQRGELYTAYTPYQPELSQGSLQAAFEYQSMICELTGMDLANASHYDGATALAEAVLLALAVGAGRRRKVVVPPSVNPQYRQVLATYLAGRPEAELVGCERLGATSDEMLGLVDEQTAALVVQSPSFFGGFEPVAKLAAAAHDAGALAIVVPDPIALGLFRSPGADGADVVAADGQPLGIPLCFGGPHLGIFATRGAHLRRAVGRLVGETTDLDGERGYVLTLGTREQHIRRERATSNICTNAALGALAAAVYLATLGSAGLRRIAELCYQRSHYAAARIGELPGYRVVAPGGETSFFKEIVVELPGSAEELNRFLLEECDVLGGYDLAHDYPHLDRHLLLTFTETTPREHIDRLVDGLRRFSGDGGAR
jgi:glycine dehydrogenase subunit 1